MTKDEAINALASGKKVRHRYFTSDEYLHVGEDGYLLDEHGHVMRQEFWELRQGKAWEIDWYIID